MTKREGLSQRGRVGIEPHLESRPLSARRRRDLHHHSTSTKSGEREEDPGRRGEEVPKGLRKDKERKREDKEREEVKEGERTTERDRERPGGQGKRDSVSDGADLRLLREWGREQDRARVST